MSNVLDLPVKSTEEFWADNEVMDLTSIKGETFLVAVNTGERNKSKFLSTTAHGPYSFLEMVEQVGTMWQEEQHHAKVLILDKNRRRKTRTLDENTIDYIEAHFVEIVTESMLDGAFDDGSKEFTCRVGIVEETENLEFTPKAELPAPTTSDDTI